MERLNSINIFDWYINLTGWPKCHRQVHLMSIVIQSHVTYVAVTACDDMWALDENGQLHRRTVQHIHCDQYTRVKSTGSVDEGWELI